jgi:hypothetical protein
MRFDSKGVLTALDELKSVARCRPWQAALPNKKSLALNEK